MRFTSWLLRCGFMLVLLSSCVSSTPGPVVLTPQSGRATLIGRIISATTEQPFPKQYVALAQVHRNEKGEGAFALDTATSPQTFTDQEGNFSFQNILPGEYVFVAGDPMGQPYTVFLDDTTKQPKIWVTKENQIINMGNLKIRFEAQKEN